MANGVGVEKSILFRESSVPNITISLAEATAAFQHTAAALIAAQSGDSFQKVVYMPPTPTSGPRVANMAGGESLKPAMASKAGISFVIPKNKLSGALVPVVRNVVGKWEPHEAKQEEEIKSLPQRTTKWGVDFTQDPAVRRGRALALQTRAEQIAAQLESGQLDIDTNDATRSPSPPPIYDSNGQRTNTREGRRREQLELERREAIGECLQLNPSYKPPAGYKPVYKEAKIYIPVKDYPGYNFIGLILGPRGNTQKRMEAETGSKIAIRGKGAVKEGKKSNAVRLQGGRRDGKEAEGAFEDLHVHITADSIEKVDAAVALIEPLLTPVDEDRNTHKRKQLRELAEMNGTMRDFPKSCSICGESGHREWHCPKDKLCTFRAKVFCQACGDGGHPTSDCPAKQNGQGKVLDKEYLNFLEELGDGLAGVSASSTQSLSAKLGAEESGKEDTPAVPMISAPTTAGPSKLSDTSLDPNQLADVLSGPQPMLITAAGPQPMPPAWTSVGMYNGGFESRKGQQQGSLVQVDGDRQFGSQPNASPMHPPGTGGHNVFPGPFTHPDYPPTFKAPQVFQGQPPPSMNTKMGGPPGPPNMLLPSGGTHGLERILPLSDMNSLGEQFPGKVEGGPGFLPFPMPPGKGPSFGIGPPHIPNSSFPETSQSRPNSSNQVSVKTPQAQNPSMAAPTLPDRPPCVPPWGPPPSSSGAMASWNQKVVSQATHAGIVPMMWESATYLQPPPSWKNRPTPQHPLPMWQSHSGNAWDRGAPSMPPPPNGQSASPPWEAKQKPWEVIAPQHPPFVSQTPVSNAVVAQRPSATMGCLNPSWNPSLPLPPPPPPLNQPWKVSQMPNFLQFPSPDNFPSSGSGPLLWRGPPSSPLAVAMPTPKPPTPAQALQSVAPSLPGQSPLHPFPPWQPQAQQNPTSGNFAAFTSPKTGQAIGNLSQPPLPGATWGQRPGGDPSRPDLSPLTAISSHFERGGNLHESYSLFSPKLAVAPPVPNHSNMHKQQVGVQMLGTSVPTKFGRLPDSNDGKSQPGLAVGCPPWQNAQNLGHNLRPVPSVPTVASNTQEVDAEYEKLMASVGVT